MHSATFYIVLLASDGHYYLLENSSMTGEGGVAGTEWFELDEAKGMERLFLIASSTALNGLEMLLRRYAAASPEEQRLLKPMVARMLQGYMTDAAIPEDRLNSRLSKTSQVGDSFAIWHQCKPPGRVWGTGRDHH